MPTRISVHYLFERPRVLRSPKPVSRRTVRQARDRLPGLAVKFIDSIRGILEIRQALLLTPKPYATLRADLDRLVPRRFLLHVPYGRLVHLPRYLKAMQIRAQRASLSPPKDQEKANRIQPYQDALAKLASQPPPTLAARRVLEDFRWSIEEYKVSCFAQELGTAQPVSPQRLNQLWQQAIDAMSGK